MNLDKRLQAVANLVGSCEAMADIGSDHAYLPAYLIESGRVVSAVAGEISKGPLTAAEQTIQAAGLSDRISARLGDGLQVLQPGEVAVVAIAGMGGAAIRGILSRSPEVFNRLTRLVCQPMNGAAGLRQWLLQHGWKLVAEDLAIDAGRLYEVIAAEPGEMPPMEPVLLEIGPLLWRQKHPLLKEKLQRMIENLRMRSIDMERSADPAVRKKLQLWKEKICELEGKMQCL